MSNIHYLKGALKQFNPTFDRWDEPVVRKTKNGMVYGRPSRGFGDAPFEYAGKHMDPEPWTNRYFMPSIKTAAEELASAIYDKEVKFTFCLCGLYPDEKGIPHHSDTVPTPKDIVVSVSYGAPRVFTWRRYQNPIKDHTNTSDIYFKENFLKEETHYILEHGDVIMFDGYSQLRSTHAVPDLPMAEERINLTFRTGL